MKKGKKNFFFSFPPACILLILHWISFSIWVNWVESRGDDFTHWKINLPLSIYFYTSLSPPACARVCFPTPFFNTDCNHRMNRFCGFFFFFFLFFHLQVLVMVVKTRSNPFHATIFLFFFFLETGEEDTRMIYIALNFIDYKNSKIFFLPSTLQIHDRYRIAFIFFSGGGEGR